MLQVQSLSYKYNTYDENLLHAIEFHVTKGEKIGLIGKNGSGKSTLIRLILNKLDIQSGKVVKNPKDLKIAYLPQDYNHNYKGTFREWMISRYPEIEYIKNKLTDYENLPDFNAEGDYISLLEKFEELGGYELESRIEKITSKMGFSQDDLAISYLSLSSGQRQRAAISELFVRDADFFILDEPTNHLDLEGIELLEKFLTQSKKTFLIITHDRMLLEKTTRKILKIERGKLKSYPGSYKDFCIQEKLDNEREFHAYEVQQKKLQKLQKDFDRKKRWSDKKEKQKFGDGHVDRGHIGRKAAKMMKRAKLAEKRQQHILERNKAEKPFEEKTLRGKFSEMKRNGNFALEIKDLWMSYATKDILKNFYLRIESGERIAIVGANGTGKSTLIKLILEEIFPNKGDIKRSSSLKIAYCSQERNQFNRERSIIEVVKEKTQVDETLCRIVLGNLGFIQEDVRKTIGCLSIGEKTKVEVATILLSSANFIIMDEPTNHLDISARESLETALETYKGTMLFTSHDRYFIRKIATRVIHL